MSSFCVVCCGAGINEIRFACSLSSLLKNLLAYATGFHICPCSCSRQAPNPILLASLLILVYLFMSKCLFSEMFIICFLMFSNAIVCSSFQ